MATWKDPVDLATTENIVIEDATPATVDGIPVVVGMRILVKNQSEAKENGIDVAGTPDVKPMARWIGETYEPEDVIRVAMGKRNAHTAWTLVTQEEIVVDTTPLHYSRQNLVFNVGDFGAVGDGKYALDGVIDIGDLATLTASCNFKASDEGKTIVIAGAGVGYSTHKTTIKSVVATNAVTLAAPATKPAQDVSVACGTDNLPAFQACQSAMSDLLQQRAGVFYVPPLDSTADVYYFLSDDFEVLCQARYEGTGVGGHNSGARILFAPGKGFRVRGFGVASVLGDATDCIISGFDITCLPDKYFRWQPTPFIPEEGQKFRVRCRSRVDAAGVGNGEWIVYYECIHSGMTSGDPEPDFWAASCVTPDLSSVWTPDTRVKGGTLVRSTDWEHWDVIFEEINGGGAATGYFTYNKTLACEPVWNYDYANKEEEKTWTQENSPDGPGPLWKAKKSDTCIIRDGDAIFACRTAAAIHSYSVCNIERNAIKGCLGPAIHITASKDAVPSGGASHSRIEKNYIICPNYTTFRNGVLDPDNPQGELDPKKRKKWGGVGIAIYGGDTNGITLIANHVTGDALGGVALGVVAERRLNETVYKKGDRMKSQRSVDIDQTLLFVHFECIDAKGEEKGSSLALKHGSTVRPFWYRKTRRAGH